MTGTTPVITVLGLCGDSVFMHVDHFHRSGETIHADSLYSEPGGKGCNQAVAACRLGAGVNFISCMGRDSIDEACSAFLTREGMRLFTEHTDESASSYACILTDSQGENRVTVYRGSAEHLSVGFIRSLEAEIAASDMLLLNNETPYDANLCALELAERHGVPAILNPAPYFALPTDYLRRFWLITPNRHEAAAILASSPDAPPEELLSGLRDFGIAKCVITLGSDGAAAMDGDSIIYCPPRPVKAADTTGAGDCFSAALTLRLARGDGLDAAMEYAANASAYSVQRKYVMPSLPNKEEMDSFFTPLAITKSLQIKSQAPNELDGRKKL